jgi:imidazoleglycerol phosphate synthase glutamine amidotransferase subunit HisH
VHRLCGHARSVHKLCEQLQGERTALCATLQDKVLPGMGRLQHLLEPLLEAAAYRALVPTELIEAIDGRHEVQVLLTQAGAQILRLKSGDQELASQLAWMEEKARRLQG